MVFKGQKPVVFTLNDVRTALDMVYNSGWAASALERGDNKSHMQHQGMIHTFGVIERVIVVAVNFSLTHSRGAAGGYGKLLIIISRLVDESLLLNKMI